MDYYQRPEVSNSDLTALKNCLSGRDIIYPEDAYKLGSLVDAMITEPDRINFYMKTLDGEDYSKYWMQAWKMKLAFTNSVYAPIVLNKEYQKVSVAERTFKFHDLEFKLQCRCKWDFFGKISGDIKTTTATTQKQFEVACKHFDYFRARAWYMDIENTDYDVIIGISKINYKIFIVTVERGDENYLRGKADYTDLAFKYWVLGNELKK